MRAAGPARDTPYPPSRTNGTHVRVFLAAPTGTDRTGNVKGNMRRKAHRKLWTLLLMLALVGAGAASTQRIVRAELFPDNTPAPLPPPGAGDPDMPDYGKKPGQGMSQPVSNGTLIPRKDPARPWLWMVRAAFSAVFRILSRV